MFLPALTHTGHRVDSVVQIPNSEIHWVFIIHKQPLIIISCGAEDQIQVSELVVKPLNSSPGLFLKIFIMGSHYVTRVGLEHTVLLLLCLK